jgi:hypothetical protein
MVWRSLGDPIVSTKTMSMLRQPVHWLQGPYVLTFCFQHNRCHFGIYILVSQSQSKNLPIKTIEASTRLSPNFYTFVVFYKYIRKQVKFSNIVWRRGLGLTWLEYICPTILLKLKQWFFFVTVIDVFRNFQQYTLDHLPLSSFQVPCSVGTNKLLCLMEFCQLLGWARGWS